MRSREVRLAPAAVRDLERARVWLHQPGSGPKARARFLHVRAAIRELASAPCRWAPWPKLAGTRKLSVEDYVVIYRVVPDTGDNGTAGDVEVIRIYGPYQDV